MAWGTGTPTRSSAGHSQETSLVLEDPLLIRLGVPTLATVATDCDYLSVAVGTGTRRECADMADVDTLATFDFAAFFAAVDDARRDRHMGWCDLAGELWNQSAQLNAERDDHPLCGGAISRLGGRGETSCQYALYLLRWLGQSPE